jgi:hypothetical protein
MPWDIWAKWSGMQARCRHSPRTARDAVARARARGPPPRICRNAATPRPQPLPRKEFGVAAAVAAIRNASPGSRNATPLSLAGMGVAALRQFLAGRGRADAGRASRGCHPHAESWAP